MVKTRKQILVVSKMGIVYQYENNSSATRNIIPDYAKDYKNEYLFIRGIDKTCGEFMKRLDEDKEEEIFKSSQANKLMLYMNRYLKAQQLGYLNDTSVISKKYFKVKDVRFIERLESILDDYTDLYYYEYSYEFDEEKYDSNIENDYPRF